jgi:hypothetical protein
MVGVGPVGDALPSVHAVLLSERRKSAANVARSICPSLLRALDGLRWELIEQMPDRANVQY